MGMIVGHLAGMVERLGGTCPVFFFLSFQVLPDILGRMVLISVDVSEGGLGTSSSVHPFSIASCSLSFHYILLHLHIVLVLFRHGLYAHASGH